MKIYDYSRKSQEDKDRQVQSFEKQIEAINNIKPPYNSTFEPIYSPIPQESKTGKIPRIRPLFNLMMDSIENDLRNGEKVGSRVWKITRLARNAPDASRVIDAVQNGLTIFTPYKVFTVEEIGDLYHEFAKAHVFSNELSRDVKEGLIEKVRAGKVPQFAPIGYKNTPEKEQGTREIVIDEDRFILVQKCWKLLLGMQLNVNQIHKIATEEWGLTNRKGKTVSQSAFYEIFTNIFYTGRYYKRKGEIIDNGIHKPMITIDEFELAQKILGSRGKPFHTTREFSYTNWLKCTCGSSYTANERFRRHCYSCKNKFNAEKYDKCPNCKTEPSTNLIYTSTYNCNRKKDKTCKQPSISLTNLEMQIDRILESLQMPDAYIQWGLDMLKKDNKQEIDDRQTIEESLQAKIMGVNRRLDNLAYKFTSPENENGELYSDSEYRDTKNRLKAEKLQLETELAKMSVRQATWMENAERAFNFTRNARYWFSKGTKQEKRAIFQAISSNPVLDNGLVRFDLLKPFQAIQKLAEIGINEKGRFEPQEKIDISSKTSNISPSIPEMCG
jgi:site-specific DNA recombinase